MAKILLKIDYFFIKLESVFIVVLMALLLIFAVLQVILRNVFDTGINWADVANRILVLWIGFFGATLAAKHDRHLSLEVLTKFLPQNIKPVINLFVFFITAAVSSVLSYYSYLFYIDQITFEAYDLLFEGFPKAYLTIIFPIGFGLLAFRYLVKIIAIFCKDENKLCQHS